MKLVHGLLPLLLGGRLLTQSAIITAVPVNQAIPDGDSAGLASVVTVSGQSGSIQDMFVSLSINGTFNGDLYTYLTHGSGFAVLLNRPGRTDTDPVGYGDNGLNIRLTDTAGVDIHAYGGAGSGQLNGTFQPDGRNVSPLVALDTTPRTATLSSFEGLDPNGEWVLFVADVESGDIHTLESWSIGWSGTSVPEPTGWGLGTAVMLVAGVAGRKLWGKRGRKAS